MTLLNCLFILLFILPLSGVAQQESLYHVRKGRVEFSSEAPLELIRASSNKLLGVLDTDHGTFAFKIPIASFTGFNSPLQREHFNENYMETELFPYATYTGKIIENVDYTKKGSYKVRTKGKFTIHGVTQERIIRSDVTVSPNKIEIKSDFTVLLLDYNIKIPRIVDNNLSKEIRVRVEAVLHTQ